MAHFGSTENDSNEPRFKSNSNYLSNKLPSCVETFITATDLDSGSKKRIAGLKNFPVTN